MKLTGINKHLPENQKGKFSDIPQLRFDILNEPEVGVNDSHQEYILNELGDIEIDDIDVEENNLVDQHHAKLINNDSSESSNEKISIFGTSEDGSTNSAILSPQVDNKKLENAKLSTFWLYYFILLIFFAIFFSLKASNKFLNRHPKIIEDEQELYIGVRRRATHKTAFKRLH